MTIKDIAVMNGISKQAVYQRIKKAGLRIDALKDEKTGDLTEDGAMLVSALYQTAEQTSKVALKETDDLRAELTALEATRDALQAEVISYKARIEALDTACQSLTAKVEMLTSERDFLRRALETEQQTAQRLLPVQAQKEPLWKRITRAIKGD